jgi:similar to stage IV sporulation protein
MIGKIAGKIAGSVKVSLYGDSPERFFNLCAKADIRLEQIEYHKERYEFFISVSDFFRLRPYAKKTGTHLRILKRQGVPFFFHRNRKRYGFFGGIVLFFLIGKICTLFLWRIEIDGNIHNTDERILKFLNTQQIGVFCRMDQIDCEQLERAIRTEFDDIIWTSVSKDGTVLTIRVTENVKTANADATGINPSTDFYVEAPTQETDDSCGYDIVADKDGTIEQIVVRSGTAMVSENDTVKKGDILVSGAIAHTDDNGEITDYSYVTSAADINIRETLAYSEEQPYTFETDIRTDRTIHRLYVDLFGIRFTLSQPGEMFSQFVRICEEYDLTARPRFLYSCGVSLTTFYETKTVQAVCTPDDAAAQLNEKFHVFCDKLTQKGVRIVENDVMIEKGGDLAQASGTVTVVTPAGVYAKTEEIELPQVEGNVEDESE